MSLAPAVGFLVLYHPMTLTSANYRIVTGKDRRGAHADCRYAFDMGSFSKSYVKGKAVTLPVEFLIRSSRVFVSSNIYIRYSPAMLGGSVDLDCSERTPARSPVMPAGTVVPLFADAALAPGEATDVADVTEAEEVAVVVTSGFGGLGEEASP